MTDFNDLLFQAEKLSHGLGGPSDLPRVDRNLRQILEASNELYAKVAQTGTQDVQANLLLGSKGIDLPLISHKLETLIAKKAFEPIEPAPDCDIQSFLKNETENSILRLIDESQARVSTQIREQRWQSIDNEWEAEKRKLLSAMIGPSENFYDLDKTSYVTKTDVMSPATLTYDELLFVKHVAKYNKQASENNRDLMGTFAQIARSFHDTKLDDMWDIMRVMLDIPPLPRSNDPITNRSKPPGCEYLVRSAKIHLEQRYRKYISSFITDDATGVRRGGLPGTYPLVRSFVAVRFRGEYVGLQDGFIDDQPVWPMVYYSLRCGDPTVALQCLEKSGSGADELVAILREYVKTHADRGAIHQLETDVKFQYRRSVRNTPDPFKRVVYCILGNCDVNDEHSEVILTADDYLWLKLSLIREPQHADDENRLTYAHLQTLIADDYGESYYQADKQPHLYFQMLALTGQFEAAIEFLSRIDRYRIHAVHMAIAVHEYYLLALPRDVKSPMLTADPDDPCPAKRLNFVRLIMLFTQRFHMTNPNEALQYYFLLRNLKDLDGDNIFALAVADLTIDCRDYDAIFGQMQATNTRTRGLIDQFPTAVVNVNAIAEIVAERLKNKGLIEDAVRMYDVAGCHEEVLRLISGALSQVVAQKAEAGSIRARYQLLADEIGQRYAKDAINCSQAVYDMFNVLRELLVFFELYMSNEHVLALEVLQRLQIIPLHLNEVDTCVKHFKSLPNEVCRVIPDVLIATMNILNARYQALTTSEMMKRGDTEENKVFLRNQAKCITGFAGSIPYRLPGNTNVRLVQMEILMN